MATQNSSSFLPPSVHQALREQNPQTGQPQDVIKHVVILMQENRSFDHYFGDFPGVRGFGDPNAVLLPDKTGKTVFDQPDGKSHQRPYPLPADGSWDTSTEHHWATGHQAWHNGWHDNWIKAKTLATMGYYDAQGVPLYRELAETFTICDAYHCSIISETTSNRNYLFSGYAGNEPVGNQQRVIDATAHDREDPTSDYYKDCEKEDKSYDKECVKNESTKYEKGYEWHSYPYLLDQSGKSWKVYQEWNNFYDNNLEFFDEFKKISLKVLNNIKDVPSDVPFISLYDFYDYVSRCPREEQDGWIRALAASADKLQGADQKTAQGTEWSLYSRGLFRTPPPRYGTTRGFVQAFRKDVENNNLPQVSYLVPAEADSEHPGSSKPRDGQDIVFQVLDALASKPEVWNSTVLFFSYDENDGLFDHVPPPVPPPSVKDEYVDGQPLGLGIRVPFIVVSPWTTGGYVCSQVFDHTSQVQFLEKWLGVNQKLISTWRRTVAGDLTSVFDFQNTGPRPPVVAGTRRARPLPYQPDAYCTPASNTSDANNTSGAVQLTLSNSGTASAHLTLYPYAGEYQTPQHFDVGTTPVNERITSSTDYCFTVTGPNGFRREFQGPYTGPAAKIALTSSLTADPRQLTLTAENSNDTDLTLIYGPTTTHEPQRTRITLKAGQKTPIPPFDTTTTHGWYDLTLTLAEDPSPSSFYRRLMGHIENNKESLTYITQQPKGEYITDLKVLINDGDPPSDDWFIIRKDLNKGASRDYLYFAYKSGDDKSNAITDIMFLTGSQSAPPPADGYTTIDVNLNKGSRGEYIWAYYTRDSDKGSPLTDLDVLISDDKNVQPPVPWHRINQDLNAGAGGKFIYLIYKNT